MELLDSGSGITSVLVAAGLLVLCISASLILLESSSDIPSLCHFSLAKPSGEQLIYQIFLFTPYHPILTTCASRSNSQRIFQAPQFLGKILHLDVQSAVVFITCSLLARRLRLCTMQDIVASIDERLEIDDALAKQLGAQLLPFTGMDSKQ